MRGLSRDFMNDLLEGHLYELLEKCQKDIDLDMQIRDDYINIYYKGNSLLKLSKMRQNSYKVDIDEKLIGDLDLPDKLSGIEDTKKFVKNIPFIKENIIAHGTSSLEREYEQLIVRANNREAKIVNEYFIIDRQYKRKENEEADREKDDNIFDLTGFYWSRDKRNVDKKANLSFMELKYSTDGGIEGLPKQISQYYKVVNKDPIKISKEAEEIFKQKLKLEVLNQEKDRFEALKTLEFSKDIKEFQFIIILIDYDHNSKVWENAKKELKNCLFQTR